MKRDIIKTSAKSINIESRIQTFIDSILLLEQNTQTYTNKCTSEIRYLKNHYPAIRTYQKYLGLYRSALSSVKGLFHHTYESEKAKIISKYPQTTSLFKSDIASEVILNLKNYRKNLDVKTDGLFDALKNLKVACKAYYSFKLKSGEATTVSQDNYKKVVDGKKQKINISEIAIKHFINDNIDTKSMYKMAMILILCTGRRPIELFKTGSFKKGTCKNMVVFSGQAKSKGTGVVDNYEIPILYISQTKLLELFERFRNITIKRKYDLLTNVQVNNRVSSELSDLARKHLHNESITFYTCRAIYTNVCVRDIKPLETDTQVYIAAILGHSKDDIKTALSYEDVNVINVHPNEMKKEYVKRESKLPLGVVKPLKEKKISLKRYNTLCKLDDIIEKERIAIRNLHVKVKEVIKIDSNIVLTQTYITKYFGTTRKAIKDYLEIIGDLAN